MLKLSGDLICLREVFVRILSSMDDLAFSGKGLVLYGDLWLTTFFATTEFIEGFVVSLRFQHWKLNQLNCEEDVMFLQNLTNLQIYSLL